MPWKNGGGETTEIAISPSTASMDNFDWRISMATVASNGAFSQFPGVERILTMIDGEGMTLDVEGMTSETLQVGGSPFTFPADSVCQGTLKDGSITDFNVMTRRGKYQAQVFQRTRYEDNMVHSQNRLVFAAFGAISGSMDGEQFHLENRDTLLLENINSQALVITTDTVWLDVQINLSSA